MTTPQKMPILLLAVLSSAAHAAGPDPILYKFSIKDPASHLAHVEATVPADANQPLVLMMPLWTPGYYVKENYAAKVQNLSAAAGGKPLTVDHKANRWSVAAGEIGESKAVTLSYDLLCDGRSVTGSSVSPEMAIINGGSAFITLAEKQVARAHRIQIELPANWKNSISGLEPDPDGNPNHYLAADFDRVADAPIIAGNINLTDFEVGGISHVVADAGDVQNWDSQAAAENIRRFVEENANFWAPVGGLPYKRYVFLNIFRNGGGGLEHMNSCLLTSSARNAPAGGAPGWLNYVSHEYFHCYNVKRFRPVELGPFDYEAMPSTPSLWISEGLTNYYGELLVTRAGITTPANWLATVSGHIRTLQGTPGRLKQTLSDASLSVFTGGSTSGVGGNTANGISYYDKGQVVGFVLDARIRHVTDGRKSLDDVMREGLKRYGYPKAGFTPEEFVALCSEVAGADMKPFFHQTLDTTEELDYSEALDWYGLRFAAPATAPATGAASVSAPASASAPARGGRGAGGNSTAFTLEVLATATAAQKAHLAAVTAPDAPKQQAK
ncbi:MAG TPA: hypothetical protein VHM90_18040 [Phycisphaerae bacterium]|nr:hypothetical protein [Phycisphaerae bacterium]